ncbi:ABC transporter ATP-binding protein [Arthrospiribacter ruber]|uniref:ATP-binding cassette domain-containing protein n=1 Tax=Arthrospiribacter ruber TaxID=2487934 RepID=A0A951IW33_9BACT|nr:ATP-binding cassette domain-containing protein [Arthrospiribacter ruber]MBW3467117.1 ATP-binding cassette domain-containing protein [Arthrospiribacter ruber]
MVGLDLTEAGKRFQYEWIFKALSFHIPAGSKCVVTGSNGSGKSTLLKCLSAVQPLTEGSIDYNFQEKKIKETEIFEYLAISAPYLELPEEFTLSELLSFHFKFKSPLEGLDHEEMVKLMYLDNQKDKYISQFSSGMKQRLKLGLCLFSEAPLLFLDEPTSNLDSKGVDWYLKMMGLYAKEKTVVICSNEPKEYGFCDIQIHIEDYKLRPKL